MNSRKEKKMKRREELEKMKAKDDILKSASALHDPLSSFPAFLHFHRNGLSLNLESGCGDKLSAQLKQYIQTLLKINMEGAYGSEWTSEEKVKRREMAAPEARYIFVYGDLNSDPNEVLERETISTDGGENMRPVVGFVHYRFTMEEDVPVLYVYELQLEHCVQGKGLGKFLMQLIELIARKNRMSAIVLTVQKANLVAMSFYTSKLRYSISSTSPSRFDPLIGVEKSYEILCKTFDHEAKVKLEESE